MNFYDENNRQNSSNNNIKPTHLPGGGGGGASLMEMMKVGGGGNRRKLGGGLLEVSNRRRALSSLINQPSNYPPRGVVINKRPHPHHHHQNNIQEGGGGGGGGGGGCGAVPLDPETGVDRPASRKLATQLSSTLQESKKQKPSVARPNNTFGECIFVDSYLPDHDQPVPMSLEEQTEDSSIPEMDHTEEIEMEDINIEETVVDIDEFDAKNPLAVVDYVEEIYTYYKKMESHSRVSPDYMARQSDINEKMRAILIDWLIEVHDKFDLMKETLFLTVTLIDRFLSQQPMARKKLQLVGLVAMLLACKYEEVSVPVVGDLIVISDKAYTRKEVLEMENLMLNKLQFNVSLPTPYVFMTRFLKAAQSDNKLEMLAFYLIELSLVEYEMLQFTPSLLAASAIFTAQCSLYGFKQWTRTCEWHTTYSDYQLLECSRKMVGFHQQAGTGKLTGVYRKYSTSKFGYTSKCEPAGFLLETQVLL